MPDGGLLVAILVALAVTIAFTWLFRRLYKLCSISVNSEGITQSLLFHGGKLRNRVNVPWDQVQSASFSGRSYTFTTANGLNLELDTALFGNVPLTFHAVRQLLPPRLLEQLNAVGD
jgi:hypothetical protein